MKIEHSGRGKKTASVVLAGLMALAPMPAIAAEATAQTAVTAEADTESAKALPDASNGVITITESGTYALSADVTSRIVVEANRTVTLQLNGHDITVSAGDAILNDGNLTITGSGTVSTTAASSAAVANTPNAICAIKGGTYTSSQWYVIKNLGSMTIDGSVTLKGTDGNGSSLIDNGWYGASDTVGGTAYAAQSGKASLTFGDGVTATGANKTLAIVKNDDYGTLTINGGTFDGSAYSDTSSSATAVLNWNVATINGGSFKGVTALANGSYGSTSADKGQVTITGGTFDATGDSVFGTGSGGTSTDGSVKVSGGTFKKAVSASTGYSTQVSGGTFANDVSSLLASDDKAVSVATVTSGDTTTYAVGADAIKAALDGAAATDKVTITKLGTDLASFTTTTKAQIVNGTDGDIAINGTTVTKGAMFTTRAATLDANGGTGTMDAVALTGSAKAPENKFTWTGHDFTGWNTKADGTGTSYKPGDALPSTGDITLYAQWKVKTYPDVDYSSSSWYASAVNFVSSHGLMGGYPTGGFGVGKTLTRAELVNILWANADPVAHDSYVQSEAKNETGLSDVADGAWYTGAANWAVKNGVVSGVLNSDGTRSFDGDRPVTCEELLAIIANYKAKTAADATDASVLSGFSDGSSVSSWAAKSVAWAKNEGLVSGYPNGNAARELRPQESIARERAAAIIMNAFSKGVLSDPA